MTEKNVPRATLQRYPVYLKALRKLKSSGVERIMSKELVSVVNIGSATTRRNFSFLGNLGKQGYGYDTNRLIEVFNQWPDMDFDEKIILVRADNMGRALMKYNKWDCVVDKTAYAFDINLDRQDVRFGMPVYDIAGLEKKVLNDHRIAILAISESIQQMVNRLIAYGIAGLADFTHEHI